MSALKPGLYKATVSGSHGEVVWIDWLGAGTDASGVIWSPADITDAIKLFILDLDYIRHERFGLPSVVSFLQSDLRTRPLAFQILGQTEPAKIEEPGLYGVVRAEGHEWTRLRSRTSFYDWLNEDGTRLGWRELIDPTLIREGVES